MTALRLKAGLVLAASIAALLLDDWPALAGVTLVALAGVLAWGGWRGLLRALALGAYLVLLTGVLNLLSLLLAGPLTWEGLRPIVVLTLRLAALFLLAGLLAGLGPEGLASLVPGRAGRAMRRRLEHVLAVYVTSLAEARQLLADGWRAHPRRGRMTAYLSALWLAAQSRAVRAGELAAVRGGSDG